MALGSASGGNGAGIKAGNAYVTTALDLAGLKGGLVQAKRMVLSTAKAFTAGGGALLGIGSAILTPIAVSFRQAIKHFDELNKASDRTGATTEALSDLAYAAGQSDASLEDVTNGIKFLQRTLAESSRGSKEAQDSLKMVGLTAEDFKGKDANEQFLILADAIDNIQDPAKRTNAALRLLGRGGLALLPMLKGGSSSLRKLFDENERTGGRVSKEDADNATKVGDSFTRMGTAIKNAFLAIGAALLPQAERIEQFSYSVIDAVRQVKKFIDDNRQAILAVVGVGAAIAAAGAAFIGIGTTLALATFAVGGFISAISAAGTVLGVLVSPLGLALAAAAVLGVGLVALAAQTETFWEVLSAGEDIAGRVFGGIADVFGQTWGGIKDALSAGDLKLAFQVGVAGLNVIWKGFLLGVEIAWNAFKATFVDGWHGAITEIELAWNDLGAAMTDAMLAVLQLISEKFGEFISKTLGRAADLAERVGATDTAKELRLFGSLGAGDFAAARADTERERKAKEDSIKAAADKAQADRDAARAASALAAAMELVGAKEELAKLTKEAEVAANTAVFAALMNDLNNTKFAFADQKKSAIAGLAGARGQSGGGLAAQALGISGESIEKKQLDELKGINEGIGDLKEEVGLKGW